VEDLAVSIAISRKIKSTVLDSAVTRHVLRVIHVSQLPKHSESGKIGGGILTTIAYTKGPRCLIN
jgi:hypothetical protein